MQNGLADVLVYRITLRVFNDWTASLWCFRRNLLCSQRFPLRFRDGLFGYWLRFCQGEFRDFP